MKKVIGTLVRLLISRSILFYSILLSFLINISVISQVEIYEEVILDSSEVIESAELTMPFYGKVVFSDIRAQGFC